MRYGVESVPIPVTYGVVQGSVAGPLLFAIMVNDLEQQATSLDIVLYADDGKVVGRAYSKQDCKRIQDDLDIIYTWSLVNRLPLSLPKYMCLHLGHNNMRHVYSLGGAPLMAVNQCTDLGLIRTSDFMYNTHIYSIISKASRASGMFFRAFSTRSKAFILKLYVAYVRPILECISVAWNPIGIGLESDLKKVQQTFTKRLYGSISMDHESRIKHLKLEKLSSRRRRVDLEMVIRPCMVCLQSALTQLESICSRKYQREATKLT